ncbi:MAG: hypothetical protein STHCBS139747_006899 [Sporothrix thermara]
MSTFNCRLFGGGDAYDDAVSASDSEASSVTMRAGDDNDNDSDNDNESDADSDVTLGREEVNTFVGGVEFSGKSLSSPSSSLSSSSSSSSSTSTSTSAAPAAAEDLPVRITRSTRTTETVVRSGPMRGQSVLIPRHSMLLRSATRTQSQAQAEPQSQQLLHPRRANNSGNPPPRGGHGSGRGGRRC